MTRMILLALLLSFSSCSGHTDKTGTPSNDVTSSAPQPVPASAPDSTQAAATAAPGSSGAAAASAILAPADAWAAIRAGALLVDVRTASEYAQGHLENALLIPHDQIVARAGELGDDKTRPIVLYCRSGNRSSQAKKALDALGYTNVMNAGGYEGLKQAQ